MAAHRRAATFRCPRRAAGRSRRGRISAPPLAQEAAARPAGAVRIRRAVHAREISSRSPRRDDVESRLVVRDGARWTLAHGPFRRADFDGAAGARLDAARPGREPRRARRRCAAAPVLVPAVRPPRRPDGELRRARRRRRPARGFVRRVPAAGLRPSPLALRRAGRSSRSCPDCRSRSCAASRPTHDDVLAPGDMLYLPPHIAHDGVAVDACTTYSIGFRAPGANELAAAFLDFLRDELDLPGRYADPDLAPVRGAGGDRRRACAGVACELLKRIAWDRATAARFLGCFLSEPKPHVVLRTAGCAAVAARASAERVAKYGAHVDRRTRLLYDRRAPLHQRRRAAVAGERRRGARGASPTIARSHRERRRACPRKRPRSSTIGTAMVTSIPAPPDGGEVDEVRCRGTRRSTTVAEQVAAIDTLIGLAKHSIRVLRHRSVRDGLERCGAHPEASATFLRASARARLEIVVRDTGWIERSCPRLTQLLKYRRSCDHDPASRRRRAIGDGSADDRRRRPFPASLRYRRSRARRSRSATRRPRRRSSCASMPSARLGAGNHRDDTRALTRSTPARVARRAIFVVIPR